MWSRIAYINDISTHVPCPAVTLLSSLSYSITLILVTAEEEAGSSGLPLSHLLELCFNAMLLLVGLPALEEGASNERLKSELKVITQS